MMRVMVAAIAMLGMDSASAQAPLFGEPVFCPDCSPPTELPEARTAEQQWLIGANVRGIAEAQDAIVVAVPDGPEFVVSLSRFEPISGFILEGANVVPDPEAPDTALGYDAFGVGDGVQTILSVREGRMSATVRTADSIYSVVETTVGTVFRQHDPALFPPGLCSLEGGRGKSFAAHLSAPSQHRRSLKPLATAVSPKYVDPVDVLVLHTPNVLQLPGVDQNQVDMRIVEAFNQMNTGIQNSGIVSIRVQNVANSGAQSSQIAYNEQNALVCPPNVGTAACNYFGHKVFVRNSAFAQNLRNATNADLVVMIVADEDFAACGVAYTQRPNCGVSEQFGTVEPGCSVGAGYNEFAYAVVTYDCMTESFDFVHEVGHQFGGEHHGDAAGGTAPEDASFPWSFAHWVAARQGSVMSTRHFFGGCGGCPRSLQFSNPDIGFLNFPATPSGTNERFNALTLALLAPTMSDFRDPQLTHLIYRSSFEALPVSNP